MAGHVRRKGKGWQARYPSPTGGARKIERSFATKREAARWLVEMDAAKFSGTFIDPARSATRFSALVDAWRGTWDLEPKTKAGYESILAHHLLPEFGSLRVRDLTPERIQLFINGLASRRAPNTVRRVFTVLRAVTRVAVERRYIAIDPCAAVKLPSRKRKGIRRSHLYLEGPQLRALAESLPAAYRVPVYVAGSCGLRAGELWALRARDVNLLTGELSVRYALKEVDSSALSDDDKGLALGLPKSAASRRTLSIPSGLRPLLASRVERAGVRAPRGFAVGRELDEETAELDWSPDASDPDRLLFTTPTGRPVRHTLFYSRIFKPAVRVALPSGFQGLRFHDLRHTCAALSLAHGGNLQTIKERLGHENIATTVDLYGKRVPSVDAALADAVGAVIFEPDGREVAELSTAQR